MTFLSVMGSGTRQLSQKRSNWNGKIKAFWHFVYHGKSLLQFTQFSLYSEALSWHEVHMATLQDIYLDNCLGLAPEATSSGQHEAKSGHSSPLVRHVEELCHMTGVSQPASFSHSPYT